ncbi:MAG: RnfABCDGE type electron transport complex subunit D [Clostridia bacterium]|nr:RnfABCDGE type electron transport complex subunit D [Clostridia bacterium]
MDEQKLFTVSASPHTKSPVTVRGIMLDVIIALIPAGFAGTAVFGLRALAVIAVCVVSCVAFEALSVKIMKKPMSIGDLSAVITGLLLAYNLPVTIPLWMCVVGSFVAIVIVKQLFGGIGQNFANPAITARIVLLVSFASAMTNFTAPKALDAVTTATPLAVLDRTADISAQVAEGSLPGLLQMVIGVRGGCIGETCAAALLIGCCWLLIRRVISPIIPLSYLGTVALLMLAFSRFNLTFTAYELLSGGLLLGAIFMATDYTTSPINKKGKLVFGIGCGLLTVVIRLFCSLPEGVSYSILLMNVACPLIEKVTAPKYFGFVKKKKEKKAKEGAA